MTNQMCCPCGIPHESTLYFGLEAPIHTEGAMVQPVIIFDFEHHRVVQVRGDPTQDRALAEALAAQKETVSKVGGTPPPPRPDGD